MSFSLLDDAWIPVLRQDGSRQMIRPWELTSEPDTPIVTLAAPRSDFAGAHVQFLIGLFQTVAAPESEREWRQWYVEPPSPDLLRERCALYADRFRLDGEYPRFMQDATASDAESKGMAALLIESPGDNTIKLNTDHFIKRGQVDGLCPACAASALFTLQTNAPSGGAGHRTSLRGGGPLSTVLTDATLWRTVWLNVLPKNYFEDTVIANTSVDPFPWMGPTRGSSGGLQTTPNDGHPLHVYWATPRRIHLDTAAATEGVCSICGAASDSLITTYRTKNYGFDYKGGWRHPLSPYTKNKSGEELPEHAQPGGIRYKHWLGFIQPTESKKQAIVVDYFLDRRQGSLSRKDIDTTLCLSAFGYDMDNMKARCWYEGIMPLIIMHTHDNNAVEDYAREVERGVNAAGKTVEFLRGALRTALRKRKEDVKYDASILTAAETQFWSDTEDGFYTYLRSLRSAIENDQPTQEAKQQWLRSLQNGVLRCFHALILSSPIEDGDPRRVAEAHNDLFRQVQRYRTLRDILDLPVQTGDPKDTGKKGKPQTVSAQ